MSNKILDLTTISEFQEYFENMYSEINSKRSWHELHGYLSRTSGYLTRKLIKGKATYQDFIRPITWLFALASETGVDLENAFIRKFPMICPYCIEPTCICHITGKTPKNKELPVFEIQYKLSQFAEIYSSGDRTFESFAKNIDTIYPSNSVIWNFNGAWMNSTKLFEEIAELQEAIAKFKVDEMPVKAVEEEFADVLAWLLSCWVCHFSNNEVSVRIKDYFLEGCPVCENLTCKCTTDDARIQSIVDAEKFKNMRIEFEELTGIAKEVGVDISDIIKSLQEVEATPSDRLAGVAKVQAEDTVNKLNEKIGRTEQYSTILSNICGILTSIG